MSTIVQCPHCQTRMRAAQPSANGRYRCTKCHRVFVQETAATGGATAHAIPPQQPSATAGGEVSAGLFPEFGWWWLLFLYWIGGNSGMATWFLFNLHRINSISSKKINPWMLYTIFILELVMAVIGTIAGFFAWMGGMLALEGIFSPSSSEAAGGAYLLSWAFSCVNFLVWVASLVLLILLSLRTREILENHFRAAGFPQAEFSPVLTFLFTTMYLQYKVTALQRRQRPEQPIAA